MNPSSNPNNNNPSGQPFIPNSLQWAWDPYLPGSVNPSGGAAGASGGVTSAASGVTQQQPQPASSAAMVPPPVPVLVPYGSTGTTKKSKSKAAAAPPAPSAALGAPYTVSAVSSADGKVTMKLTKTKAAATVAVKAKTRAMPTTSAAAAVVDANANSNIWAAIDSVAKGTATVSATPSQTATRAPLVRKRAGAGSLASLIAHFLESSSTATAPTATVTSATLQSAFASTAGIPPAGTSIPQLRPPAPIATSASIGAASLANLVPPHLQSVYGQPRTLGSGGPNPFYGAVPPPAHTQIPLSVAYGQGGTAATSSTYQGLPAPPSFPYYPPVPVPSANIRQPRAPRRGRGRPTLQNAAGFYPINTPNQVPPPAIINPASMTAPLLNLLPPPPVHAEPLVPPNWQEHYDETSIALSTYKTFPVDPISLEYQTITEILDPIKVTSAELIVNPDLWERYVNTRKEMLRTKSDDLALLSKIGLDEKEVMRRAHFSLNFDKDPLLTTATASFSPNEVLLFHCTRNKDNLNKILLQGLDERLSSTTGGLLGKGIYFSDDPQKAMQYDGGTGVVLIFAVLLGDCLGVDHIHSKHTMVREPEKENEQKRNFNDQFFDSITARPAAHNEFVIYNRFQCCPLYKVNYQRGGAHGNQGTSYSTARQTSPTVAWRLTQGKKFPMPNQTLDGGWPFFAVSLFEKMGVLPAPVNNDDDDDQFESLIPDSNSGAMVDGIPNMDDDDDDTDEKLASLQNLGFFDDSKNREVLQMYNNNLDRAANHLLDSENQKSQTQAQTGQQPSTSGASSSSGITIITPPPKAKPSATVTTVDLTTDSDSEVEAKDSDVKKAKLINADLPDELADWALEFDEDLFQGAAAAKSPPKSQEECHICCYEYDSISQAPSLWKQLQCSHKVCALCYKSIETSGTTMAGVFHTSVKCPFCQGISGAEVGTCPTGKMTVTNTSASCEGYEGHGTIQINYLINSGPHSLNRTAYLPDNAEGKEVLKLLRVAWDRRLCFTIGTSVTTGAQNVLVWNIHHKTAIRGGVQSHGYPDPGYLERVKWELKAYGIE